MSTIRKSNFKAYHQDQGLLLPPYLGDLVPVNHLSRVVNRVIDSVRVEALYDQFSDLGCSAYHPLMMLKVIIYAYCQKVYSNRKTAQALRQDVTFMWLSGMQTPSYRSIGRFRSVYFRDIIEDVFTDVLDLLHQEGYIKFEEYFVDGTMIEADANKYSHVWLKNTERYKKAVKDRVCSLLLDIDTINKAEDDRYGDQDLEEMGDNSNLTSEKIKEVSDNINSKLQEKQKQTQADRKIKSKVGQLRKESEKMAKYEEQEKIGNGRKSFSKTDEDATFNRMKDDSLKPSYNWQVSSENQFITNFTTGQNAADSANFPDHFRKIIERGKNYLPKNYVGDMGYGSEENFNLLDENQVNSYLKYPGFSRETKPEYRNNPFVKENFKYAQEGDFYICPQGKKLKFKNQREETTKRGFAFITRNYQCTDCSGCIVLEQCTKSKEQHRSITVNRRLDQYRTKTRDNLNTETGISLRKRRSFEIKTFFGDLKHNQSYRRIRLRGLLKANLELAMLSISYNLRKLCIKEAY